MSAPVHTDRADVVSRAYANGAPVEAVGPYLFTRIDGITYYAELKEAS